VAPRLGATMDHRRWDSVTIEKADSGRFDARFVMSAASPDRVRDTIDPASFDAIASKGAPLIALFNHDTSKIIGAWSELTRRTDKLVGGLTLAGTQLGQMVRQLISDGVPLGASIGFRAKGIENPQGGIHWSDLDLIECSIVATPAHPRAVQIAKSYGITLECLATSGASVAARKRAALAIVAAKRAVK